MARYPKYAPEFRLEIDGEFLEPILRANLSSITYQNGLEGASRVEVTFANPDLRLLGHSLFQLDKKLRLAIGYQPDPPENVFYGEITSVEPSFPNSGMPTLKIVAHDFLHKLTQGSKNRGFRINIPCVGNFPLPDSVIASWVSLENLLIPYPDPVGGPLSLLMSIALFNVDRDMAQKNVRIQSGQSDFDFLSGLAKENGWEMYIDYDEDPEGYVLRFQFLIQDYKPELELVYGKSLMDFSPRLTSVGDLFGISARIWVPGIQTEFVVIVSWDYDRAAFKLMIYPNLVGELDDILGPANASKTLSVDVIGFADCLGKILGELLPRLNNRQTGSGSTLGDSRIRAGKVIALGGLGEEFGGLYRVTSATHTFDSNGYRTQFEARKEVWFGSIPLPTGTSGLFRVQGNTIF